MRLRSAPPKVSKPAGAMSVLAILATGSEPDDVTPALVESAIEGPVSTWYRQVSRGRISGFRADVTGWLAIPGLTCGSYERAIAAAAEAGYEPSRYDRQLVYMPATGCGPISGSAILGESALGVYGRGSLVGGTTIHELGHTFGLAHSNSWTCTVGSAYVALGDNCRHTEYGGLQDVMGAATANGENGSFGALGLDRLGWLKGQVVDSPRGGGTFTIRPIEAGAGLQAVRLRDEGRTYWLYYRQPIGVDSFLASTPGATAGISAEFDASTVGQLGSEVVDLTPDGNFRDVTLKPGSTWTTPSGAYRVRVVSVGSKSATFAIAAPRCLVRNKRSRHSFQSLQGAAEAAVAGDRLEVAGTCPRSALVKDLTLQGVRSKGYGPPVLVGTRGLLVESGVRAAINDLTISGGASEQGGGIANWGTLTLNRVAITGNLGAFGGGIANFGTLTVNASTITRNRSSGGNGGGIFNWGQLTIAGTTISENESGGPGGGVYNVESAEEPSTLNLLAGNSIAGNAPDDVTWGP